MNKIIQTFRSSEKSSYYARESFSNISEHIIFLIEKEKRVFEVQAEKRIFEKESKSEDNPLMRFLS